MHSNRSLTDSYRTVSLHPFIAKMLERVVFNQLSSFLSKNHLLDTNQSGFRCGHSTEMALLSITEALRIAKADSKSSILILLDLSAASVLGSVLGALLFSTCTTALGPIIQAHGISNHCYADDTALSLVSTRWSKGSCTDIRLQTAEYNWHI